MSQKGKFFVIEGGDGSGKGTQTARITEILRSEGKEVMSLSFPRYGQHSATTVEMYLRGEFGEANAVAPQLASAGFALDRVAAAPEMIEFLQDPNHILLADRYVFSNLAHQGTKLDDEADRSQFYRDSLQLEFGDLRLPRPDKNIILLLPSDVAQENVDKKSARSYTSAKRDIHEKDLSHLTKANRNYQELAKQFPVLATATWVYNFEAKRMRDIDAITHEIRQILEI